MTSKWLFSKRIDLFFLFIPVWAVWAICFALPTDIISQTLPLWAWAVFILGFDVTHVWSTIFRTYTDKEEFNNHKSLLIWAPIIAFVAAFLISFGSSFWFWRIMAYLALFHFVKQQFGFFALYRAKAKAYRTKKLVSDKFAIYFSMLFPVIYWHLSQDLEIAWFVDGDFLPLGRWMGIAINELITFKTIASLFYFLVLSIWLIQDIKSHQEVHWGKVLWLLTTAGNWYIGIVLFNSDIVFSVTNVVAHGLPYLVLVFVYKTRKEGKTHKTQSSYSALKSIIVMLVVIVVLATLEEYFWDIWLNRSKQDFFGSFLMYPQKGLEGNIIQSLALTLLSVPQVSHYIIDGYIWKNNSKNPHLVPILLKHES